MEQDQEELAEGLRAAHWLVERYDLGEVIEALPLSAMPPLMLKVQASIIRAVEDFVADLSATNDNGKPTEATDQYKKATKAVSLAMSGKSLNPFEREQVGELISQLTEVLAETL